MRLELEELKKSKQMTPIKLIDQSDSEEEAPKQKTKIKSNKIAKALGLDHGLDYGLD
jgi:hypothetical protein